MKDLKKLKIWTCWIRKTVSEKIRKIPIAADGGKTGANREYENSWVTYEEANESAKRNRYDGTMFVVPEGYFFLDIDDRDIDDPLAKKLIRRFGNTYSEYSVSTKGIHIYGKCDLSKIPSATDEITGKRKLADGYYTNNRKLGVELYIGGLTNHFAVYTNYDLLNNPLADCTEQVLETLGEQMKRESPPVMRQTPAVLVENAQDIDATVEKLCLQKNGEKFKALFFDGDISRYSSHSEADVALCAMIAFRTGPAPDLIDAIFSKSALFRSDKWGRADYRKRTIERAIQVCGRYYTPDYNRKSATGGKKQNPSSQKAKTEKKTISLLSRPSFVVDGNAGETISAPLLAEHIRQHTRYVLVRNDCTENLNCYVYDKEKGVYRMFDTNMLKGLIKQPVVEYNRRLLKMGTIREACDDLMSDLTYVRRDDLDAREDIINFENCLLKVTADSVSKLPHSPDILSATQIPCIWTGHETPTPVFDKYLETLTDGDRETQNLLLQVLGVCISNVRANRMKKSLILVGEGDTGKSQLKRLAERLVGKGNYIGIDLSEIEARFGTGVIYGTRIAGSSDMGFMTVDELRTFKKLTGEDAIFAEYKSQQGFTYVYRGFLWFCTNKLPKFGGDDGLWVYNRIMVVNCRNVIPKEKQDKDLLNKMYAEREGIVYKAVHALQEVIRNGYRFSEGRSVIEARREYADTNSTVVTFIQECMKPREADDIYTTGVVLNVYYAWCRDNNHGYAKNAPEFRKAMAEYLGIPLSEVIKHTRRGSQFPLTLTEDAISQYRHIINR